MARGAARRRLLFGALITLLLAATVFGLSFVVGPTTHSGKVETSEPRSVPAGTRAIISESRRAFGPDHFQGEVRASFRFQLQAPVGQTTLFDASEMTAVVRPGHQDDWTMLLELGRYSFPVIPQVKAGRWYAVTFDLANQDQISAAVNGSERFDLSLPNSNLNVSFGHFALGSPRGSSGAVSLQNFRLVERTYTTTSPATQTVLRLVAALLFAASVVMCLLFVVTSEQNLQAIGLAPRFKDDRRSTLRLRRWVRFQHRWMLPLGLAALAAGVTLLVIATPPENNVLDQTGSFRLTVSNASPNTQKSLDLGSFASIGRSTATMDVTLSFLMRVGTQHLSGNTIVVTTQDDGNGINFFLDPMRRLWTTMPYAPMDNSFGFRLTKPLPIGRWTSVEAQLTRGQKVTYFVNGETVGYQEFSIPGWQGAAQILAAGTTSTASDVSISNTSLDEELFTSPVPRTKVLFSRGLQVLGFLLVVAGVILLVSRLFRRLFPRLPLASRPLVLVVFGVVGLGILVNVLIDILHLQTGSTPYVTRNTWIFSLDDSFTDFLNPLVVFRARDAYSHLSASYPPVAYWLIAPLYWVPAFSAVFVYLAAFVGFFLWWIWRSFLTALRTVEALIVAFIALVSFPVTYSISRANIDISLFVLFAILVACLERERLRAAASLMGITIAAKVFPALFLVVFFRRTRWRFVWLALAVAALTTLLAFLWFTGSLSSNIHNFYSAFFSTQTTQRWQPVQISFGTNLSVWAQAIGYAISGVRGGSDVASVMQNIELPIEIVGSLLLIAYASFIDRELWRVVTLIVTSILLLPTPSGDYQLLYLFVPLALFLRYADPNPWRLYIAVVFGLLLAPRVYFFVGDYFVGTDTLLTAPLLILLAVLVAKDGFAERSRQRDILATRAVVMS